MRPPHTIDLKPGQSVYATVYKGGRPHWVLGTMVAYDGDYHYEVLISADDDDGLADDELDRPDLGVRRGECRRYFHMHDLRAASFCSRMCGVRSNVTHFSPARSRQ